MTSLSRGLLLAALISSTPPLLYAEAPTAPPAKVVTTPLYENPDPAHYLFEDQLRPGMKGFGLTVMHAGKIEKFDVEIIDVIRNFSPGINGLLVRCSGLGLEHSGIIAGMSGSPVYIDNKMIGAIAYGWGMAKDPIAGVQPIRNMLALRVARADLPHNEQSVNVSSGGMRWAENGFLAREAARQPGWGPLTASLARRVGALHPDLDTGNPDNRQPLESSPEGLRPLASPLMVGGASPSTLHLLQETLRGDNLVPVASGTGAGSTPTLTTMPAPNLDGSLLGGLAEIQPGEIQLAPGSSISIPLLTGDMDLSAIGTVTEVRNGKVYAFGHEFMADGPTRLPMATGYIYTIMPNVNESFKVGTSIAAKGTLVADEKTGIAGILGDAPPSTPITMRVRDAASTLDKTYHYQLADYPRMTAELLGAAINETLIAQRNLPRQFTVRITGHATFEGPGGPYSIDINNLGATQSFNPMMTLLPIVVLADNPFENLKMTELTVDAHIQSHDDSGTIRSVTVDRLTVAPGDTINAIAEIVPFQKETQRIPLTIKIPDDARDGSYELTIGSSGMALMQELQYAPQLFDPQNIAGLANSVEHIMSYQADGLYATLVMNISGATISGHEMRNLPGSRIALYSTDRRSDGTPLFTVVKESQLTDSVLDGGQTFAVTVDRNANRRYFEPHPPGMPAGGPPGSAKGSAVPLNAPAPASEPGDGDN